MSASIVAIGCRTAGGLTARQTARSVLRTPWTPSTTDTRDRFDEQIGAHVVPALDGTAGFERLVRLAAPALRDALRGYDGAPPAVFIALPYPGREDDDPRFGHAFVAALSAYARVDIDIEASEIIRAGHAGGALAAARVLSDIRRSDRCGAAIWGGVDSYNHGALLARLDAELRLHSAGAEEGFVPSEAAAFLRLARPNPRDAAPMRLRFALSDIEHEEPFGFAADAMTRLMAQSDRQANRASDTMYFTDINGERYRVAEWMKVCQRMLPADASTLNVARVCGDTGAASGPLAASIATVLIGDGIVTHRHALIALHSDGPERGVVMLEGSVGGRA
jgi:3-oxoacyl-[acyl-carrier-protein] synthase-1